MNRKILHLIGNAHIDPVWLWVWTEGLAEVVSTFRSALDRMNEFPEFSFTASSAALYAWVEKVDPAMFEEIRQRVAEGRWCLTGGWWIEPDCNIPGGEAFARQGLYGQRFFLEKFGVAARVGYNVDSFGHHAMLPQILKKSGMDAYVFMRPQPHEKDLPGRIFWWEGDDSSRILTCRLPYQYATWEPDLEDHVLACGSEILEPNNEMICFYGVGNHGGGPTVANLESLRRLQQREDLPKLVFSSPDQFFNEIRKNITDLPVVHDDLQHHSSGCYSAHSKMKKWNRQVENVLLSAEKFSAIASWGTGASYPSDFSTAWKSYLFNQFHDILAGTSIESAYEDVFIQLGESLSIARRNSAYALQMLSEKINIPFEADTKPFAVFNPHSWTVKSGVEVETGPLDGREFLLDAGGFTTPYQIVQSEAEAAGRKRMLFLAEIPPMGYQIYRLVQKTGAFMGANADTTGDKVSKSGLINGILRLENEYLCLDLDSQTGFITNLMDKRNQAQVLKLGAARPVVIEDMSDTWSHAVTQYDQVIGEFHVCHIEQVADGPVKSTLRVTYEYDRSTLRQEFSVYQGLAMIEVRVSVDWHEQFKMLKIAFPAQFQVERSTYEIPFGFIERPTNGEEEPGQRWVDVAGFDRENGTMLGFSLLNDGKYSFDVHDDTLFLTVLRSPIYAHHMPYMPEEDKIYSFMDQGKQEFVYVLLPHAGRWEEAETVRLASQLNQPAVVHPSYFHQGHMPMKQSFLQIEPNNVALSALKLAEDGQGWIIRAYETEKKATQAVFTLPYWNIHFSISFEACEIKTIRIPYLGDGPIIETNLIEWDGMSEKRF